MCGKNQNYLYVHARIRVYKSQRLIKVSTVCLQNVSLNLNRNENPPNNPLNGYEMNGDYLFNTNWEYMYPKRNGINGFKTYFIKHDR